MSFVQRREGGMGDVVVVVVVVVSLSRITRLTFLRGGGCHYFTAVSHKKKT